MPATTSRQTAAAGQQQQQTRQKMMMQAVKMSQQQQHEVAGQQGAGQLQVLAREQEVQGEVLQRSSYRSSKVWLVVVQAVQQPRKQRCCSCCQS
jgi:hypothetical protein